MSDNKAENEELTLEEQHEKYREAGKIHSQVKSYIKPKLKVGVKLLDICAEIESKIKELGGEWAFPTNISINNIAAHYTSPIGDELVIEEGQIVKVDFGVHVDGFIADGAFTVGFKEGYEKLIEASEKALSEAINSMKPGVNTSEVGKVIEKTIKSFGFRPIRDLSGHILSRYELHGAKTIPNIKVPFGKKIEQGEVYAVETFATTGQGYAHETPHVYIYNLIPVRAPIRSKLARSVLGRIIKDFKTLPFAQRWLGEGFTLGQLKLAFRELVNHGLLHEYHVLADVKDSYVSQAEHTVIIGKDGAEVTTL